MCFPCSVVACRCKMCFGTLRVGLLYLIFLSCSLADPLCNGTYHQLIFPKLYHSGSPIEVNKIENLSSLTLVFTWRTQNVQVYVEKHDITPENSVVEFYDDNKDVLTEALNENETQYQGHVLGAKFSFVAMAIKGVSMTGYIQYDDESIYIEPSGDLKDDDQLRKHTAMSCNHKPLQKKHIDFTRRKRSKIRTRRAPGQYTKFLEILLVADTTVVDVVGKNRVKSYLLTLMNIVNEIYHDDTLGVNIEVVTVKIIYMDKSTEGHVIVTSDPQRTVDQFCYWASTQSYRSRRYARQTAGSNHDAAVLLTRHKFTAAGYAPITGMCVPMRNCAFVKDDGFTSAFVIAHEVGHIFGLMHDGHGNNCYGSAYATSIMATMVQSAFNRYWWSGCSKTRMKEVIGGLTCLNNNPLKVIEGDLPDPVGISWSLDEQCMFEFGKNARHCNLFRSQDPCSQMWCSDGYAYQCKTKNVIPLDGTTCGPSKQWYCKKGVCGYHGNEKPLDGNWGQWGDWSDCSAECGIGFKRRSRLCDSPKPKFGGNSCDGESENVDTCKAKIFTIFLRTCTNYEDTRAYQCSIMDIVPVRGKTHVWLPYQSATDRCKLTCISQSTNEVVTFDSLVDNGTPCSYDDYNSICIDGKCQLVGCDGVRGSDAKEDKCGVCQGDGTSCKTVSGIYSKKFEYSAAGPFYETMLVLPKGSRHISIAENSVSPHFLSVQDTIYFKHVVNPDGKQGRSKNFALEGAWFKYYNNGGYEKLDSKGPLQKKVNVMIYPTNWQRPANVRYSYTVDKNDYTYEKNKYQWKFEDWSACSVTCGKGVQHIIYACYDKEKGVKVDDEQCKFIKGGNSEDIVCTRPDCDTFLYLWRMLRNKTECSATCGDEGTQIQMYECEIKESGQKVDNQYCSNIPAPIVISVCNRFPCAKMTYEWEVTSEWSECSASCGDDGSQHQLYYCLRVTDGNNEERVDEKFCSDLVSPKEPRPCNRTPCVKYKWTLTEDWLQCNQTCGETGLQKRKVVCQKHEIGKPEKNVGIWYCRKEVKPIETRPCNVRQCYSYRWRDSGEWGECSRSCGNGGVKEMVQHCINVTYDNRETRVAENLCNDTIKPRNLSNCNDMEPCETFEWIPTVSWTECSESCGVDGIRSRLYKCVAIGSNDDVADSICDNATKPVEEEPCNVFPCQNFSLQHVDEWYPKCPNDCREQPVEIQTRMTKCFEIFENGQKELTDDEFCTEIAAPALQQRPCEPVICSTYAWEESGWSPCSETCGKEGIQTQTVQCVETNTNGERSIVNGENCATAIALDPVHRTCQLPSCLRYEAKSDWLPCSVTCGTGTQSRDIVCVLRGFNGTDTEVNVDECKAANITTLERQCIMGPCGFMEWGAGPWSMCSRTCGPGKQKRIVYCGDPLKDIDSSMCPGQQPDEYQDCQIESCSDSRPTCRGDRAAFCRRASTRLCGHTAYKRVCCASCGEIQQDQPRPRYRNYWDYRRRRHYRFFG